MSFDWSFNVGLAAMLGAYQERQETKRELIRSFTYLSGLVLACWLVSRGLMSPF